QPSPWLASPLPRFAVRRHWPQNVIPLGNAAAALEPIGGEGMGLALRSAEVVAEGLLMGWPVEAMVKRLPSLWRARALACRAAAPPRRAARGRGPGASGS